MTFRCRAPAAAIAAAVFMAGTSASVSAQEYPAKPIRIIVPFTPGGATDIIARLMAQRFYEVFGQVTTVENRPGAGGNIGADVVAKSPPDGYTLMLTSNGHTVAALVSKNVPFDPVKDFAGITRVSSSPLSLIVYPGVPVKKQLGEFETLLSNEKLKRLLGWKQQYYWRDEAKKHCL